uniref:Uncharacterized protein n=1 Tax=Triticum urartu TaxID=4572 RepID=A0A8R7QKD0_TRIUA
MDLLGPSPSAPGMFGIHSDRMTGCHFKWLLVLPLGHINYCEDSLQSFVHGDVKPETFCLVSLDPLKKRSFSHEFGYFIIDGLLLQGGWK